MTLFEAMILGLVEGLTEFLPVSSTAHLILASRLLGLAPTEFLKSFEIIIQAGAIAAVGVIYFKELIKAKDMWVKIAAGFFPSAVVGFVLYGIIKKYLLSDNVVIPIMLLAGGFLFLLVDKLDKRNSTGSVITVKQAILVGLFQSFAVVPGVSRAASAILGGVLVGLKKEDAVKFSFFLAVPTIMGAAALDLVKSPLIITPDNLPVLLAGGVVAFISAFFAVKTFIKLTATKPFWYFSVYRIMVGLFWVFLLVR